MAPKKIKHIPAHRVIPAPPAPEPRAWDKLIAAQKAVEEAEREYGQHRSQHATPATEGAGTREQRAAQRQSGEGEHN